MQYKSSNKFICNKTIQIVQCSKLLAMTVFKSKKNGFVKKI